MPNTRKRPQSSKSGRELRHSVLARDTILYAAQRGQEPDDATKIYRRRPKHRNQGWDE